MRKLAVLAVLAFCFTLGAQPVSARGGLKAQVFITQANIPSKLSERGLINFMRGHRAKVLKEVTDVPIEKRKWLANMVIAFNQPPNDMEFHVLFYDVTGGRTFIEDMTTMVGDKKQRTYLQKLKLRRPRFQPNRMMEMIVTVRRAEVGRLSFNTYGETPKRSGQVDFSDEEAK